MQTFYCFYLDKIQDTFFKEFLFLFYSPSKEDSNCIIVDRDKLEHDFQLYQQCSIFLAIVKKKITFKKIDFLTHKENKKIHEKKFENYYEPSYENSSDFEIITFFNQILSKEDASIAEDIYIKQKKLFEIAQDLKITPQAVSKKKKNITNKIRIALENKS